MCVYYILLEYGQLTWQGARDMSVMKNIMNECLKMAIRMASVGHNMVSMSPVKMLKITW